MVQSWGGRPLSSAASTVPAPRPASLGMAQGPAGLLETLYPQQDSLEPSCWGYEHCGYKDLPPFMITGSFRATVTMARVMGPPGARLVPALWSGALCVPWGLPRTMRLTVDGTMQGQL